MTVPTRLTGVFAAAACLLLVTACGSAAAPRAAQAGARTLSAAARVSLVVTIYPPDDGPPTHATLRCEPAGGTAPHPAAACARLLADPSLLEPPTPGRVIICPMILASSARVVVDGTYLGRQVNETIRDGGCDLRRWAELRQIFPTSGSDLAPVIPGYPVVTSPA
jgi:hypothetical protein